MEDNFQKKVDIDCSSSVQFEVIPPDVANIPLPEDVSQIPLPTPNFAQESPITYNAIPIISEGDSTTKVKDEFYDVHNSTIKDMKFENEVDNSQELYKDKTACDNLTTSMHAESVGKFLQPDINEQVLRYQNEAFARSGNAETHFSNQFLSVKDESIPVQEVNLVSESVSTSVEPKSEVLISQGESNEECLTSQVDDNVATESIKTENESFVSDTKMIQSETAAFQEQGSETKNADDFSQVSVTLDAAIDKQFIQNTESITPETETLKPGCTFKTKTVSISEVETNHTLSFADSNTDVVNLNVENVSGEKIETESMITESYAENTSTERILSEDESMVTDSYAENTSSEEILITESSCQSKSLGNESMITDSNVETSNESIIPEVASLNVTSQAVTFHSNHETTGNEAITTSAVTCNDGNINSRSEINYYENVICTNENDLMKAETFSNEIDTSQVDGSQVDTNSENITSEVLNDSFASKDSDPEMFNSDTSSVQLMFPVTETNPNLIMEKHEDTSAQEYSDCAETKNREEVEVQNTLAEYVSAVNINKESPSIEVTSHNVNIASSEQFDQSKIQEKSESNPQTNEDFMQFVPPPNDNTVSNDQEIKPQVTQADIESINQQNTSGFTESGSERLQISDDNIEFVVDSKETPISKTNLVDYIQTHDPTIEEDVATVQYIVTNDNEQIIEHAKVEYENDNGAENVLPEGVQYVVSETANGDPNEQSYVQYVVADNTDDKLTQFHAVAEGESGNHPEYIQYVVSEGSIQENMVQYVVTSAGNDKDIPHHVNSENFVSYIVSDTADEKDVSRDETSDQAAITYEVIDESSQEPTAVVIEEMEVENNTNDQNEDIEIYVIEDDNMQVIEVHVENPNMKNSDNTSEDKCKTESNNRKRAPTGNYIEVVDAKGDTTAKLPCHVLGRNLKNPEADVLSNGRNPPKVRPGVKVPPLSLTSCIVSSEEISEEIDKKLKAEVPVYDKPKVGDILFKHKITKRLAEKLCTNPGSVQNSPNNPKPNQNLTKASPNTRLAKKNLLSKTKPKLDNADLLAILEGDEDPDWSELKPVETDQAPPILQAIEKSIISGHSGRSPPPVLEAQARSNTSRAFLKLDSEEKRRLAQHQLLNLPNVPNICSSRPRGRPKLTDYNPLKHTLLKNAGMAVYTTPRSKDPPKTYSNRKANDIIKTLVSDWDEESKDGSQKGSTTTAKDQSSTTNLTNPTESTKKQVEPNETTKTKSQPTEEKTVNKVGTTAATSSNVKSTSTAITKPIPNTIAKSPSVKSTTAVSKSTPTPIKAAPTVATKTSAPTSKSSSSANSSSTTVATASETTATKSNPPVTVKRKNSPSTNSPQLGIVPNKIARVIKKKIIWDPDNPMTSSSLSPSLKTVKRDPQKSSSENSPNNVKKAADIAVKKTVVNSTGAKKQVEKQSTEVEVKKEDAQEVEMQEAQTPANAVGRRSRLIRKVPHKPINPNRSLVSKSTSPSPTIPKKKKLTEIDRLLSDEGAVNMIYSVERRNNNAEVPEIVTKPNKRLLISLEKERRNLLSKANIIKQAVLRHSSTAVASNRNKKPLRFKKSAVGKRKVVSLKKRGDQTRNSTQSSLVEENTEFSFTSVNESRIIRRHSSSSFSSTCTSPRRLSVDGKTGPNAEEKLIEVTAESELSKPLKKRQKGGVPIYSRPAESEKSYKGKTKSTNPEQVANITEETKTTTSPKEEEKVGKTMSTRSNKKVISDSNLDENKSQEDPPDRVSEVADATEKPAITEDDTSLKDEAVKNAAISKKLRKTSAIESEKTQVSKEQKTYEEISIRKHETLVQIILTPTSTKFKNSLSNQVRKM